MAVLTNSLLDDKKEALTESNIIPIAQQDDNKVKPEPSIDSLNNGEQDVDNKARSLITPEPINETVQRVDEVSKLVSDTQVNSRITPEHEALVNQTHKLFPQADKNILRNVSVAELKATIEQSSKMNALNNAPTLADTLDKNPALLLTQNSNIDAFSKLETQLNAIGPIIKDTPYVTYGQGTINALDRGVDRFVGGLLSIAAGVKTRLAEEADLSILETVDKNFMDDPHITRVAKAMGLDPNNEQDRLKAVEYIQEMDMMSPSFGAGNTGQMGAIGTSAFLESIPRILLNTIFGEMIFGTPANNPDQQRSQLAGDGYNLFKKAVEISRENKDNSQFSAQAQDFQKGLKSDPDASLGEAILDFANAVQRDPVGAAAFLSEVGIEFTPVIAAGAATSLATKNPLLGVSVASGGVFITENDVGSEIASAVQEKYKYNILTEDGFDAFINDKEAVDFAIKTGRIRGTTIGLTQLVQFGIISKLAKTKSVAAGTTAQVGTSLTAEGVGEGLAQKFSVGKVNWNEVVLEVAGGTVTMPLDIATATATWHGRKRDAETVRSWLATGEIIEKNKGKLSKEGQDLIDGSTVIADQLKEKGVDTVYIEADKLTKFDQDRPDSDSVIKTLGLDADAVTEAATSGQRIAVDTDAYVRHILGVDGFMELHTTSTTTDPDGMTGAELEAFDANLQTELNETIEEADNSTQLPSMNEADVAAAVSDTKAIEQNIKEQIGRTGNFDSQQTELLSMLTAQRYAVRAARISEETGEYVSPMKLFNEDNLIITGSEAPTNVQRTTAAAPIYTEADLSTIQDIRTSLTTEGVPDGVTEANTSAVEAASSQTIDIPVANPDSNSIPNANKTIPRVLYYTPLGKSDVVVGNDINPATDETGVVDGVVEALNLTTAPRADNSVAIDMVTVKPSFGVGGNLKETSEGSFSFQGSIKAGAQFAKTGEEKLRSKKQQQILNDISKAGIDVTTMTDEEVVTALNNAAQEEAEAKFEVDQNNPVNDKKTPAVFPPEQTLSKESKKKLAALRKEVPGFSAIASFLQPDEIQVLTTAQAVKLVETLKTLPNVAETAASARAGRAKLGWYRRSKQALDIVFGADAPRFTALLAALSPQTSVESNLINALNVWTGWVAAGRPQDVATIKKIMADNVQGDKGETSVLSAWVNNTMIALLTPDDAITLSGPKVNSFSLNLQGFESEVTNDAWMANWGFVDQQLFSQNANIARPGKSPGYMAMTVLARRAAVEANMDPMEVQETIWSMAKALYERASAKGETRTELQILEDGDLTHEMIGDVPDFSTLLNVGEYKAALEAGGYQQQLANLNAASIPGRSNEKGDVTKGMSDKDLALLKKTAKRLGDLRKQRKWESEKTSIQIGLSSATGTIPGLDNLHKAAMSGDRDAFVALQEIAFNALEFHTSGLVDKKGNPLVVINKVPSYGFYGGEAEPSLSLSIEMTNADKPRALAALARFAEMFNQEQIHVREAPAKNKKKVGYQYTDGSFNTSVIKYELNDQLNEQELTKIIDESGLVGFSVGGDGSLLAYYLGDPNDAKAIEEFETAIQRADKLIGSNARKITRTVERLWAYGRGYGATNSYGEIRGNFQAPKTDQANKTAIRLAARLAKKTVNPTEQAGEMTPAQEALQTEIMEAYEAMQLDNLADPNVRRAYEELIVELLEQFDTLPVKVEVFQQKRDKDGNIKNFKEPYTGTAMSEKMRLDINQNNHLFILETEPGSFGPEGVVYEDHPLLRDSGRVDVNGQPLLMNDLLRAVHDYYAHTMSTVGFGPLGEEAAWRNHMLMTRSPWARWALTSETRGQNSWTNFNPDAKGKKLSEREFAEQKVDLMPLEFVTTGEPTVDTTLAQLPGSEGLTLEQTRQTNTGGTFTPKDQIQDQNGKPVSLIQIFESADRSTFLHESGHFWLEQLKQDAMEVGGKLDKDWTTVKRWWSGRTEQIREEAVKRAKKDKNSDAASKIQSMTENQLKKFIMSGELRGDATTRYVAIAMHEQFARGFENYLKTGEAPSFTLLDAFTRFAAWMTSVYRAIKRMGGYNGLDVKFSPEVDGVLDRMLATDTEIAEMKSQYKLAAMFETAAEAGMTQKEFNEYRQKAERAVAQAKAKQLSKKLKDLESASLEERKNREEQLRPDIEAQVAELPLYKLMHGLSKGTDPLGNKVEPEVGKINRKMLIEMLGGKEALAKLPKLGSSVIYGTGKDTTSPGAVAAYFGFPDADAMLKALSLYVPFDELVNQKIAGALIDEGPVVNEDATELAIASVHETDLRAEVIQAELDALRTSETAFKLKFVRAMARQRLLNKKVSEVKPALFLAAQKKAAKEAGKALRAGDKVSAYKHKFNQLVNYEMAKEAIRLQKTIATQKSTLVKYKGDRKKHPGIDADYMDRVRQILDIYSLGPKMGQRKRTKLKLEALARWMADAEAKDGAIFEYPAVLAQEDRVKNYNDLSVADFEDLYNSVQTIIKQGRLKKKLLIGKDKRDRAEVIATLVSKLSSRPTAKAKKARDKNITTTDLGLISKGAIKLAHLDAALLKVELLLEMMDDGEANGPWHQAVYQPFADAAAASSDLTDKIAKRVNQKLEALPKEVKKALGKRVDVGELALPGETWQRGALIMMALNIGNESNLTKMIEGERGVGRKINKELIDKALDQLTKEEWQLIQDIWTISEELFPAVDAIYRQENGRSPARVEPTVFTNRHGTWTGGYFPMMYDHSRSSTAENIDKMDAIAAFQSQTLKASLNSSMTKERSENFSAPIDFRIERLLSVFNRPIHFITHYEAVRNANKILGSKEIETVVNEKVGSAYYNELKEWVGAIASNNENQTPVKDWEQVALAVRNNVTVAVLGLSYTTMAAQLLGYTATIDRLMADTTYGPISAAVVAKDLAIGATTAFDPEVRKNMFALSGEMRHRLENTDREVRNALRQFSGKKGLTNRVSEMAMLAIAGIQMYGVDVPTWIAAYNRALRAEPNNVQGASNYADRVVRISQTAGGLKDLNAVQRKAGVMKIFTMFYSFFALLYGVTRQITGEVKFKNPLTVARAAARIIVLITVAEAAQALLTDKIPDFEEEDEDGDKVNSVPQWLATRTFGTLAGTVPFVRDIAGGMLSDFGYSMSPVESFGENLIRAVDYIGDNYEYYFDEDAEEEDKPELKKIKPLISTLGVILGLPGAIQFNRGLSAWIAENDEDMDDDLKPTWFDYLAGYTDEKAKKRLND